jgi:glutathione S-transferase
MRRRTLRTDGTGFFNPDPVDAGMSNLVLYELEGCPYCAKVKRKLDELGLEYEARMVPRSHAERTEVKEVSGQTGVPVLVDPDHDVEGMPESDDIVRYLEETYGRA